MLVAIYARVSTTDQSNSIQVAELTDYAARRGWTVAGIYSMEVLDEHEVASGAICLGVQHPAVIWRN